MATIRRIEVTVFATGKTHVMTRPQFFKTFGKAEGREILAGHGGEVSATAVVYDTNDTSKVAFD